MIDAKLFDEFSRKLSDLVAQSPLADIEKNSRAMLGQMFARLDLVTREEFDVQQQLLLRTREKLAQLEARVEKIEAEHMAEPETKPIDEPGA